MQVTYALCQLLANCAACARRYTVGQLLLAAVVVPAAVPVCLAIKLYRKIRNR